MSKNTIVGLPNPSGDIDICSRHYVIRNEPKFINIVNRIERIGQYFIDLRYVEDKDKLFNDVGHCLKSLSSDLKMI